MKDDFSKHTNKYDSLHVPVKPLLLFKNIIENCYINIYRHAPASVIKDTRTFHFYMNITVNPTLITTNSYFFLLNIYSQYAVSCNDGKPPKVHDTFAISIIKRTSLCHCTLETKDIYLIGSEINCTDYPNFEVKYSFNFVTEWLYNKPSISLMYSNKDYFYYPSITNFPSIPR